MSWLATLDPILQAFLAGLFTWAITALGALLVVVRGIRSDAAFDAMLGFASGIMLAASFWSLLAPAIEIATLQQLLPWVPAAVGFAAGALFLAVTDRVLPHLHPMRAMERAEGPRTTWSQTTLLILAITLHNIPEGLAVGVAFGALSAASEAGMLETTSLGAAVALAVGIGLQNFLEGAAVASAARPQALSAARFPAGRRRRPWNRSRRSSAPQRSSRSRSSFRTRCPSRPARWCSSFSRSSSPWRISAGAPT
jgi:ZIP family zinc transporter